MIEPTSVEEIRAERKRHVALGYRILAAQRWGDLGDGHISARDPEREDCFWMLRYGVSYHAARVADLVLVGPDGKLVDGEGVINIAGYYIHHPILVARPDAVSAVHVHTGWGTPFSAEVRPIEPITQESCIFFEDHAIFDDEEVQVQSVEAGTRIAAALGPHRAIILRNHGLLTVAGRVDEAVGSFVQMERVAESHMKARKAKPISAEAARFAQKDLTRFGIGRVGFWALVSRHIGDPTVVDSNSLSTKLYYGFGSVAYGVKDNGFAYFLLLYYNQVLGLPASWVGGAILTALVFDAFSDPVVGYASDNLHSRWGRRHPFMYASVLPVAISFYALWNPPAGLADEGLLVYLIVVAIAVRTFITLYEIPSSSLVAELTTDYDERTSFLGFRYFFGWWGGLGMALITYLVLLRPTPEHPVGQLNPEGWQAYGAIASLIIAFAILVSALGTHRHIPQLQKPPPKRPFSAGRTLGELRETLSNRSFLVLFASAMFAAMATGLITSLNLYFNTYFWELTPNEIGVLTLGPFVSAAVALAAAPVVSRRFGKRNAAVTIYALAIGLAPTVVGGRLLGVMPANGSPALVPILFVYTVVEVTLIVTASILMSSMVADTVEESQLSTGRRSEGVFFAARSFIQKSVHGIGVLSATVLLTVIGFPQNAQPGQVEPAIVAKLGWVYLPVLAVVYLLSLAFVAAYRISRADHQQHLERLAARGEL